MSSLLWTKPLVPAPSLPPHVLRFLTWLEKTEGRDKLYRFVVYFSKFVVQTLQQSAAASPDAIRRIAAGASVVATSRKRQQAAALDARPFMALLEYLQDALQSFALADAVERVVSVLKGSSLSVWLLFDHVQWLQKAGYLKLRAETLAAVDRYHSEAWFSGLLFGALLCLYRLQLLVKEERLLSASATPPSTAADILHRTDLTELRKRQLLRLQDRKAAQVIGVVKNMTDLIIPAARLRWLLVSDGTVGLAGSITSCIGVYQTYPKR